MKKFLLGITALASAFMVGCSSGGDDEAPINSSLDIYEPPKAKIRFYEDTVFVNKSGGSSMAFLSSPRL